MTVAPRTPVGFIGLGRMGKPMALNLIHGDTELFVLSRARNAYPELGSRGAQTLDSLSGMGRARIVFLSLPGTDAVQDVLFGRNGLAQVLQPGAVVIDTSTIEYEAALDIHTRLQGSGISFLDAPVSGMRPRAEQGTLTIMCGGPQAAYETAKPWLARIGSNILHMGPAGSGQLAKLVNQLLFDINCAALAEVLPMACRLGLAPAKVAEIVNSGTGRSHASEFFLPRILRNRFSDGYPLQAAYKDLVSAAQLGARRGVPMPVAAAATATYQMALLRGHGSQDKGAMIKFYEELLDVRFRGVEHEASLEEIRS